MNVIIMMTIIMVTIFLNIIIDCLLLRESDSIVKCINKIKKDRKYKLDPLSRTQ